MKFVVLGGYGAMGSIAVRDLYDSCKDCEITITGRDLEKAKVRSCPHSKFKCSGMQGELQAIRDPKPEDQEKG